MAEPNLKRRAFLRGRSPKFNQEAIRPPWSLPFAEFIDQCERCDACVTACSEDIIFKGDGGFPEVDLRRGECTFCKDCIKSCEAGAFRSEALSEQNAWSLSVTVLPSCLSLNAVVCRVCGEHCDEQAIYFKLQLGGVSIPKIDEEKCTGCGACLFACPNDSILIKQRQSSKTIQ